MKTMSDFVSRSRVRQIEPGRRLVSERVCEATGMTEYYDDALESRALFVPDSVTDRNEYGMLLEAGVSLLPAEPTDGGMKLLVPEGAQTLRQVIKSVAQDIERYKPLFIKLGGQLGALHNLSYGLSAQTEGRSVLSGIGFATSEGESFKNSLFFLPPFVVEPHIDFADSFGRVSRELRESEYFSEEDIVRVTWSVFLGVGKKVR